MIVALPLAVAAAVFGGALWLTERRRSADPVARVAPYVRREAAAALDPVLPVGDGPLAEVERALRRLPFWPQWERAVVQVDVGATPTVAALALAGALVVLAAFALLLGASAPTTLFLVLLVLVLARVAYAVRVTRRRRSFDDQLPEILTDLGSALRAGHGFDQALQAVAADAPEPAGAELQRVLAETRLGRPLEQALTDLGQRIGSRDLLFALDAIIVQRQVGGSLATIFELVADTVRQRHQYALRLRALTAMGRSSALVLLALPFVVGLGLSVMSPGYLSPLLASPTGRLVIVGAIGLLGAGSVWLRRIVANAGGAA